MQAKPATGTQQLDHFGCVNVFVVCVFVSLFACWLVGSFTCCLFVGLFVVLSFGSLG